MSQQQNIKPSADQPRVSTQSLDKGKPDLQYKIQGVRSYTPKNSTRVARQQNRG